MARIRDTKLYQSNADYIKPFTRKQFECELTKVKKSKTRVIWGESAIYSAFIWDTAPQGNAYWNAMDVIINRNKEM